MAFAISACAVALGACSTKTILTNMLHAAEIIAIIEALPPASDLANFDASEATEDLNFQNMSLNSNSGNVTIAISDQSTGDLLGRQTFSYYVNAQGQVKFTHPGVVTSWVRSFSTYTGYVKVKTSFDLNVNEPAKGQTATAQATGVYNGTPWTSATITILRPVHCTKPGVRCKKH